MQTLLTVLLGIIALGWVIQLARVGRGMSRLPRLGDFAPLPDAECPSVSLLVAGRDEAEKLPRALESLAQLDYPKLEIVAVNDRSKDATGELIEAAARANQRLRGIHVRELPPGWLGKPHALQQAYEASSGEWLLFTDADVRFAPDVLRRAMAMALERGYDHLPLMIRTDIHGFWEAAAITCWMLNFLMFVEPWQATNPRSKKFIGIGAFQLIRRSVYQAIGTHRRLALEVVDDIKLGKMVKQGGFRGGIAAAEDRLGIRWHEGLGNIIRGLTKNSFAFLGYNLAFALAGTISQLAFSVLPFLALPLTSGFAQVFAGIAVVCATGGQAVIARHAKVSPLYGLTHPVGACIMTYSLLRSTAVTLWRGGVVWRDTFYPLAELRKGIV